MLGSLLNKDSKYNKFIFALFAAAVAAANQLGYPDVAKDIVIIGGALGVALVGNAKEIVQVPAPPA